MTAKFKNQNDVTIISIGGTLDIEYTQAFKETCLQRFLSQKVIFNMHNVHFVGSTGIHSFMEAVKGLSSGAYGLKLVGVKSEFRRIFQNLELLNLEIFETEEEAKASFSLGASH